MSDNNYYHLNQPHSNLVQVVSEGSDKLTAHNEKLANNNLVTKKVKYITCEGNRINDQRNRAL